MTQIDNTALRYFLEVARSGSLSKASGNLYVAVSALSRQIAKLEEEVGAALFERRPRGMVLSDAGRLLAEHARRSLLDTERVTEEIRGLANGGRATIRVASSEGRLCPVAASAVKALPTTMRRASSSFSRHSAPAADQNKRAEARTAADTCCDDSGPNSRRNSAAI